MPYKFLREAIELGNKNRIQKFLEDNQDVNLNEIQGPQVPLMNLACRLGNLDIVKLLYQHGAKISMNTDYYGYSPLTEAIRAKQESVVAWLLKTGGDVNEEDNIGYTPLTTATECLSHQEGRASFERMLSQLLQHADIQIDQPDAQSYTALYLAAQWGELELCARLLNQGADYRRYPYIDFIEYIDLVIQDRRSAAQWWLQDKTPKHIAERFEVAKENIVAIFQSLIMQKKYQFASDLINTETWGEIIKEKINLNDALKSAAEGYIACIKKNNYLAYDELFLHLRKILFYISLGLDYSKVNISSLSMSCLTFLIEAIPRQMMQEISEDYMDSPACQEFLKYYNEGRYRKMLGHRFGLGNMTKVKEHAFSVEGTLFCSGVLELKYAYTKFLEDKIYIEKLQQLLNSHLRPLLVGHIKQAQFEDTLSKNIMVKTAANINNIFSNHWYKSVDEKPKMTDVLLVPITTYYASDGPFEYHVEAFALFSNRLLKMNRGMGAYEPGIEIYKTKFADYDQMELGSELEICMDSLKNRLNGQDWESGLMEVTGAKFLRTILKKPQSSGNCGWATAKLLVFASVYASIFQFCKTHTTLKDGKADEVASLIANRWYKLFTRFDRCDALDDYLHSHSGYEFPSSPSLFSSVGTLQRFLQEKEMLPEGERHCDIPMLQDIYQKQMKKLMRSRKEQGFDKSSSETSRILMQGTKTTHWNWHEYVVEHEDLELLKQICSLQNISMFDSDGNNILHHIARSGKYQFLVLVMQQEFIDKNFIFDSNFQGLTPLAVAIYHKHWGLAKYLIEHEPKPKDQKPTLIKNSSISVCFKDCCDWEEYEAIDFILQNGGVIPDSIEISKCHAGVVWVLTEHLAKQKLGDEKLEKEKDAILFSFNGSKQSMESDPGSSELMQGSEYYESDDYDEDYENEGEENELGSQLGLIPYGKH